MKTYLISMNTIDYKLKGCYQFDDPNKQYDTNLLIFTFKSTTISNFSFSQPQIDYICDPLDPINAPITVKVYNEITESSILYVSRVNNSTQISIDPKFKYQNKDYDFYWKDSNIQAICDNKIPTTLNHLTTLNCTNGILNIDQTELIVNYELIITYDNKINPQTYRFRLIIGNRPILNLESTNFTLNIGQERSLSYSTNMTDTLPKITKNGQTFDNQIEISSKSIRFLNPARNHEGQYQLSISNEFGVTTLDFIVYYVLEPCTIITEFSRIIVLKGRPLNINCQVQGNPILSVDLLKNLQKLSTKQLKLRNGLTSQVFDKESSEYTDDGEYTCTVETIEQDINKVSIIKKVSKNILRVEIQAVPNILKDSIIKLYRASINNPVNFVFLFEGLPLPDIQFKNPNGEIVIQQPILSKDVFNINKATYPISVDVSSYGNWTFIISNKQEPIDFDQVQVTLDRIDRPTSPINLIKTPLFVKDNLKLTLSWKSPIDNGGAPVSYKIDYCFKTITDFEKTCMNISNLITTIYQMDVLYETVYTFKIYAVNIAGVSEPLIDQPYKTIPIEQQNINEVKSLTCIHDQESISVSWTVDSPKQSYEFNIFYCTENDIEKSNEHCVKNLNKTKQYSILLSKLDSNHDYSIIVQPQIGSIVGSESKCFVAFKNTASATAGKSIIGTGGIIGIVVSVILIVLVLSVVICYTAFGKGPLKALMISHSAKKTDTKVQYKSLPLNEQPSRVPQPV